jgi:biotin transport system substrate-specific component
MTRKAMSTRDLCLLALFVAIVAVLAQIVIPLPFVPLTMQTFAVALAGVVLGARKGSIAVLIYVLLGALGAPVFSAFQGGLGMLAGTHGGYILSFPLLAFVVGLAADKARGFWQRDQKTLAAIILAGGLFLGMFLNLSAGSLQLMFVLDLSLPAALSAGMLPFLLPEFLKAVLVFTIAPKLRQFVSRGTDS